MTAISRCLCRSLLVVMAVSALARTASAHDIWITTTGPANARQAVVNYGHPRDRPPTAADKIVDLKAISPEGGRSLLEGLAATRVGGAPVIVSRPFKDSGHTLIAVRYDNGYWVQVADNLFRNASKRFVPNAKDSMWSAKFGKALTGPGAPWSTVLEHELELVPLSDPAAVKPGESLRVRLIFRGTPLPDAQVERSDGVTPMKEDDIPRFRTDADGIATIPIVKAGPVLLAIDHRVAPSGTPEIAAADLFNATLWFAAAKR